MIFGNINNICDIEKVYSKSIIKAINYLKDNDFVNMKTGVYNIMGDDIIAQVVDRETKFKKEAIAEVHRKYVEIQFSVLGNEIIGYARDTFNNIICEELLEEKDSIFYNEVENEFDLIMVKGSFAIFFSQDVHRSWCICNQQGIVRKVNIKIKMSVI
ncbi:YhcH/YjgK/YiaL family protein [Clostridium estertheticum]|uniref:YhcH/YjgK/YiaL family protein n=1 Tax=Clostridium estertheticum TaxID=238834 RepID=UPI001C0BC848|nr:YhcH/YjgK/YiaL family protein [Clostridium estertheticum]MBU3217965.1 YhcH/YjgK/YiaL family protein [Clostridium estertheticum]WAG56020.1 YhcH/YjgK/YiaL family protein [Clostridium estertheticum]